MLKRDWYDAEEGVIGLNAKKPDDLSHGFQCLFILIYFLQISLYYALLIRAGGELRIRKYFLKLNLPSCKMQHFQIESITTKQLYSKSLELFNVEIRKSGRGHVVFVTDGNGNPVRFPIRLSDFTERPKFFVSAIMEQQIQQPKPVIDKFQLGQLVRDLNRLVERREMSKKEIEPRFKRKKSGKRKGIN